MRDSYTRYPRAILWLLRGGRVTIGGAGGDTEPAFEAEVGAFYISKTPITNRQYQAFDPGHRPAATSPGPDDPAVGVGFNDAHGYCEWYARLSRKPMRLPTEVEWEYACRGGTETRYFFGDDPTEADTYLCDAENSADRIPSLQGKRPNPFGLYAMLGGLWEWTASLYLPYPARDGDGRDDPAAGGRRVLRGGSFRVHRGQMGSAVRRGEAPEARLDDVGFRVARALSP